VNKEDHSEVSPKQNFGKKIEALCRVSNLHSLSTRKRATEKA